MGSPYSVGTWGSCGGSLSGGAVHVVSSQMTHKLNAIAAHFLQASPDDIEPRDDLAFLRNDTGHNTSLNPSDIRELSSELR
ncbi:xanthine dehydrogenase molybdopterin-binding subunit B [Paenochrobactrum gallinarii]|uniref:Xanthine dehydrogenase molybdopterin-binding subunit B n=1 Tax=Paenochrobactrum gallinarii TaxID=643673 RepID=A0A841LTJ6_9HYPH|nr:molybdopterin cofactor-binding domain-containing protein [Paenochrobactrum gallinarii]MBB6261433.1 xanthine dehydrogenase molybdopterin-binding subunit B [Paenochrobactrum gallinarii]